MTPTTYQTPEIRDSNDNIIKQGSFGKNTALANSTNDGWIDYVANDLEFLYGLAKDEVVPVSELPSTGDTNKTYLLTTTGVCYRWDGTEWVEISSSEAVSRADSAAYLAEQWATKTSGTVDGTEYSAKYYAEQAQDTADDLSESLEQIATNTANIEENAENIATNTANITQNATDIDIADKRISNIEKLLQGQLYDYQTDTDSKYTKTVLAGAMPYASLDSIGGKTLVWNQLIAPNDGGSPNYCSRVVSDGVVTCTVLSLSQNVGCYFSGIQDGTHLVLASAEITIPHTASVRIGAGTSSSTYTVNANTTTTISYIINKTSGSVVVYLDARSDYALNETFTFKLNVFDLTLMFGAGNEPSTVAEFESMFPASYYSYNAGTLLSAGVTSVVSKKADTTEIATYPIPAEIQALEGYGWSAGQVYNYIDYERKKFVKCVDRIDLGTLTWTYQSTANAFYTTEINNIIVPATENLICPNYVFGSISSSVTLIASLPDKQVYRQPGNKNVFIKDSSYNGDANAFATAMSGVYLYYELATPVETDISAYITDDNLIEVEAGGTLTFPNSNGTDYQIPVPSSETYMVDLQSAL